MKTPAKLHESSGFRDVIGSALPTFSKVAKRRRNKNLKAGAFRQRLRRFTKTPAKLHESSGFRDVIRSALPTFSKVARRRRNKSLNARSFQIAPSALQANTLPNSNFPARLLQYFFCKRWYYAGNQYFFGHASKVNY
jgi:hypothetical protein